MTGILKVSTSNRRVVAPINVEWKCHYCHKIYAHEKSFMKHQCPKKKKLEEIKTPLGQSAYASYSEWMKFKKRSIPSIDTFTTSRMYNAFIKFSSYSNKLNITASVFIKLMVDLNIEPVIWCRDGTYSEYLKQYDKSHDPGEQVVNTLEFLKVLAEKEGVQISEVFKKIGFRRFLEYFRLRKITPWVIFNSDHCMKFLHSLDIDDMRLLEGIINYNVWAERFSNNKEDRELLSEFIKESGL